MGQIGLSRRDATRARAGPAGAVRAYFLSHLEPPRLKPLQRTPTRARLNPTGTNAVWVPLWHKMGTSVSHGTWARSRPTAVADATRCRGKAMLLTFTTTAQRVTRSRSERKAHRAGVRCADGNPSEASLLSPADETPSELARPGRRRRASTPAVAGGTRRRRRVPTRRLWASTCGVGPRRDPRGRTQRNPALGGQLRAAGSALGDLTPTSGPGRATSPLTSLRRSPHRDSPPAARAAAGGRRGS